MTEAKNLKDIWKDGKWDTDYQRIESLIKERIKELEEHKEALSPIKTREDGSRYQEVRLHKREELCPKCGAIAELKRLLGEEE